MNIANWLHASATATPDAPAIFHGEALHATYGAFAERSRRLAAALTDSHGVKPGDRVALFLKNCPDYLEILYAVWWAGGVTVPVNNKLHPKEAAWIVEASGASVVFTDEGALHTACALPASCAEVGVRSPEYRGMLESAAAAGRPYPTRKDDVAWLFYTSGTTGRPKGVMLTHWNLAVMTFCYGLDVDRVEPGDQALYAAPMSHGAGLYNFAYVRAGARHVVPVSQGFDPEEIIGLARHHRRLSFFAAPTMVKRLTETARTAGYDGDGIKLVVYGGGPMYAADIDDALSVLGPRFAQIYGQGESPMTISVLPRHVVADETHPRWRERRASVGYAQACIAIKVVDDDLREVPAGTPGEILVSGDTVMKGYWNNADATGQTVVDGWLRTGDIGRLDEDGFLTLTDRSKDVIISGGTNIYPREVEEVLARHPAILEVSVIGVPEPEWGEQVVAFVVRRDGMACDTGDLENWCRAEIASFKKPRQYVFCDELPKNSYGKILKTALRDEFSARRLGGSGVSGNSCSVGLS
ncbi:class I adenylate-forming enzyme family protein [Azospirillum agricola]|uniref:class I adenylate-forming enzyme family protein n=1 Tax=Azospirillum agricola TaxID=1720247 RepID=UPI000A0EFE6D|nr:AMP-binding protein [Azospirillum agricola]SMH30643.1 Acyl-CoA synthetase (AMP-forming)/AMP-acid ligase II [Azospirillum lipoferum]